MRRRQNPLDRLHEAWQNREPLDDDPALFFNGWGRQANEEMIVMCESLGRYADAERLRADFERARDEWLAGS